MGLHLFHISIMRWNCSCTILYCVTLIMSVSRVPFIGPPWLSVANASLVQGNRVGSNHLEIVIQRLDVKLICHLRLGISTFKTTKIHGKNNVFCDDLSWNSAGIRPHTLDMLGFHPMPWKGQVHSSIHMCCDSPSCLKDLTDRFWFWFEF